MHMRVMRMRRVSCIRAPNGRRRVLPWLCCVSHLCCMNMMDMSLVVSGLLARHSNRTKDLCVWT